MRHTRTTRLCVAFASALASATFAHLYFLRVESELSGGPRVPLLVAASDIPVGAPVTEAELAVRDVPRAYVEDREVRSTEVKQVVGARVLGGLKANETLLWTDLAKASERARVLSALVENGMRAVLLDEHTATFAGLLRPGDHVDVLFTTEERGGSTTTLLQNLLVLAVGDDVNPAASDSRGSGPGSTVSLSTTVEQAQRITLARERGHLTLTVRNPEDIQLVEKIPETTGSGLDPNSGVDVERSSVPERERLERVR